ncbi:hypothetical protein [Actinacidiphila glaucinigra]|uniref:hypothetical protein n=1 Tax=Actinacidiphila glaucinigra TaxID=235986 RepID=UPI003D9227A3
MWIFWAPLVLVIALASWVGWRARRHGEHPFRDGAAMSRDVRDARRDIRAWKSGSLGHSGQDISWMTKRH